MNQSIRNLTILTVVLVLVAIAVEHFGFQYGLKQWELKYPPDQNLANADPEYFGLGWLLASLIIFLAGLISGISAVTLFIRKVWSKNRS